MAELIPIVAIFFVIGVPVMSLATHFVLRPLVGDIVSALRGETGSRDEMALLRNEVAELHESLARHEARLDTLTEAEAFRRQLEIGREQSVG